MVLGLIVKKHSTNKIDKTMTDVTLAGPASLAPGVASGFGQLLSKQTAKSAADMAVVLHNKIAMANPVFERESSILGKLANKIIGHKFPCHIEINGIELAAILHFSEQGEEIELLAEDIYLLPMNEASKLLVSLKSKLTNLN